MRHRKKKSTLDRKRGPRVALMKNLATQFIIYEKLVTTEAKAKVLRPYVERLITKGKMGITTKQRQAVSRDLMKYIPLQSAVRKTFDVLAPRYADRNGGYTRIVKMGQRQGDGARAARIEFV